MIAEFQSALMMTLLERLTRECAKQQDKKTRDFSLRKTARGYGEVKQTGMVIGWLRRAYENCVRM